MTGGPFGRVIDGRKDETLKRQEGEERQERKRERERVIKLRKRGNGNEDRGDTE